MLGAGPLGGIRLPRISAVGPPPPPAAWVPEQGQAAQVARLLGRLDELECQERRARDFFQPRISPIKGILNCNRKLGSWDCHERHRFADVMLADKFRGHELEVMQKVRERFLSHRNQMQGSLDAPGTRTEPDVRGALPHRQSPVLRRVDRRRALAEQDRPSRHPSFLAPRDRALLHWWKPKGQEGRSTVRGRSQSCEPATLSSGQDKVASVSNSAKLDSSNRLTPGWRAVKRFVNHRGDTESWTKQVDVSTGRYYYFNTEHGITSWDPPPVFVEEFFRHTQLERRKREEARAQQEMLELQLLIEDSPHLLQELRNVSKADARVNAILQAGATCTSNQSITRICQEAPHSAGGFQSDAPHTRPVSKRAASHPAARDLEEMASTAQLDHAHMHFRSAQALSWAAPRTADDNTNALAHSKAMSGMQDSLSPEPNDIQDSRRKDDQVHTRTECVEGGKCVQQCEGPRESEQKGHTRASLTARYGSMTGADIAAVQGMEGVGAAFADIGARIIIDSTDGTVSRLCDQLNSEQSVVVLQQNWRMRRSRNKINRIVFIEELWRRLLEFLVRKSNHATALLLNHPAREMVAASIKEQNQTLQLAKDVHLALKRLEKHPRSLAAGSEDFLRFCKASCVKSMFGHQTLAQKNA